MNLLFVYFISVTIALAPFASFGMAETRKDFAGVASDLLNPDKLFNALKQNITVPISSDQKVEVPTPEQALKDASPKLQEVNRDVKEETGIDLAKFIGWFAKILRVFFQTVIDILEAVSGALDQKN